jgi:hypothetical protein
MGQTNGFAWNKLRGAMIALVLAPWRLLHFDPPRSYLFACSLLCSAWYEAFGLLPNIKSSATLPQIYQAFRAMPAGGSGLGSRVVGLLGIVLAIAGMLTPGA